MGDPEIVRNVDGVDGITLEGNLGWQGHRFRFRFDHWLPMEMDRRSVFRFRRLRQRGRRLHLVPGALLRPIVTWRDGNLAMTADLAEADIRDAKFFS